MSQVLQPFSFDRAVRAVELVKQRMMRASAALESADIPYAIAGGNAIAAWVTRVDPGAVRNTPDVDVLVRRIDFPRIRTALESAGFVHRHLAGVDVFLDGVDGRPRDGVHLVYAGEKVREHEPVANPEITQTERAEDAYEVLALEALVQIKLTSFRDKDRTHLRDLIDLGLVDRAWVARYPAELGERLRQLLDNPE